MKPTAGTLIAGIAAVLAAAFAPGTVRADTPGDMRFGVMTHFAQGWDSAWIPSIAQASIPTVRDELYWSIVEPRRGFFVFPRQYEDTLAELNRNRVSPMIVLSFENPGYDGGSTPFDDDGFAGYANYAAQILGRYGDRIHAVEIWNEYNGTFCKGPAMRDRADTYLKMLRTAYAKIKAGWPTVTVAGGATSGIPRPYWEKLMAAGALQSMDVLSVHPYRYNAPPEGLEDEIGGLRDLVKQYNGGKPKPIWVTEIGWATKASTAPGDPAIDETTQAEFLVRAYGLLLSAQVERIYWYLFRDDQGLTMGLVRGDARNTPKPAYFAMANLIRQLKDAHFIERERTPARLYSLLFRTAAGAEVRMIWSLDPMSVPASGAAEAVDMLGNPLPVSSQWSLDDAPIFVRGPLTGLPPPPPTAEMVIADSVRDFSSAQGGKGWSYGMFMGDGALFTPLSDFAVTDWTEAWEGAYPYLSLTAGDQHPSASGLIPVAAARRWVSDREGNVRIQGRFQCGTQGDGVGVSIRVGGRRIFRTLLGGGGSIVREFDTAQRVHPGTPVDFVVDPGRGSDINYDATALTARIGVPSP